MKKFLAVFTGTDMSVAKAKWDAMTESEKKARTQEGMQAWEQWASKNQKFITDMGSPLGKTKKVDSNGVNDISNQMAAYVVVQAENHEDAAKLFIEHPHFTIFPGEGVEIMECFPVPSK